MQHKGASRIRAAAALAAGLVVLTGCSGGDASSASDAAATPSASDEPSVSPSGTASAGTDGAVIAPGRPGEQASTGGPGSTPTPQWNDADTTFLQQMVPHHAQALEMSRLARTRATSRPVRALAARIRAAQSPEILTMSSWLAERGIEAPTGRDDMGDMGGTGDIDGTGGHAMQGMLSDQQMQQLARARGTAFDRLFLRGMTAHHQGAVEMAERVAVDGSSVRVSELAAEIVTGQSAEIARMRDLASTLPGS